MPHATPPQGPRRPRPRAAFTLIELLTVIAIVGILAAILIPVVGRVRQSARTAHCTKNLHGIGTAFQLYAAENKGLYPALRFRSDAINPALKNPTGDNWQTELSAYQVRAVNDLNKLHATTDSYVFCPQFVANFQNEASWKTTISTTAGYGMNPNLGTGTNTWDTRFLATRIPRPSRTILAGDSGQYHLNIVADWKTDDTVFGGYSSGDPVRHSGKAAYLFADGHVAILGQDAALEILVKP